MKNCRRWRRRSSNLKPEFKAKNGWLETHLWHAKRCKMIDYWGFKIAAHLNEKCLKSTYRASVAGILLHDFSYWQPFWMDTVDMEKLAEAFGDQNVLNIVLEYENVQICPVMIIKNAFLRPLLFLHPASIQTGILVHITFRKFVENYGISYSSAAESLCTFKLHGPKSEEVIKQFLNIENASNFPIKVEISDPRVRKIESKHVTSNFDGLFLNSVEHIPSASDDQINCAKSELCLTESIAIESETIPIAISKSGSEYFLNCPRSWARVIWYKLLKIKPVKVAGIEQVDVIAFENESPVYPRDFVGSPGHEIWSAAECSRLEEIHNKKPPAKRPNYAKLRIESPFKAPFKTLKCPLVKSIVEIDGKGIITEMARIYTESRILIGFVTSASRASLKKGRSAGIASVNANFYSSEIKTIKVLVGNLCSPETFRKANLKFLK